MPSHNLSFEPPIIAHRGASIYAPENTLSAFRKAKEIGVNWVEFDVMLTKDEEVVVIHDETLDRTTNGIGRVIDYPYSYIQTLDAGSWFDPKFKNEKVPTLGEVLDLVNHFNLSANIEIKPQIGQEELIVSKVLELIKQHWINKHPQLLISSFSLPVLELVKEYSPGSFLGFLMHDWDPNWQIKCDQLRCVSVDVNHEILDKAKIENIKASKRKLLAYTVNNFERACELFDLGVDGVFSDNPERTMGMIVD